MPKLNTISAAILAASAFILPASAGQIGYVSQSGTAYTSAQAAPAQAADWAVVALLDDPALVALSQLCHASLPAKAGLLCVPSLSPKCAAVSAALGRCAG